MERLILKNVQFEESNLKKRPKIGLSRQMSKNTSSVSEMPTIDPQQWQVGNHKDDFKKWMMMMMIAFITIKSSLVPLIAGLCA